MRGAHSTRIITMWDSSKISGKVGCSTSRLMFGTRQGKDREENLGYKHVLTVSVLQHRSRSPSVAFLTHWLMSMLEC